MTPFLSTYRAPLPGGHTLLNFAEQVNANVTELLLHACDTSGNFHFQVVSVETNEVLRRATSEEVRACGVHPELYLNAFMVEEPPVEEPPADEGETPNAAE